MILIVIVLLLVYTASVSSEDHLTGFWMAEDDSFTREAEISSMMLYVGEPTGLFSVTRECYLVIMNGLSNQALTLKYWKSAPGLTRYKVHASVHFAVEQVWSDTVSITVDKTAGVMRVNGPDGTLYARLYRRPDILAAV